MKHRYDILSDFIHLVEKRFNCRIRVFDFLDALQSVEGFAEHMSQEMIHDQEYCLQIKSAPMLWRRCVLCKWTAVSRLRNNPAPYYGECFFSVGEYVYPLVINKRLLGYVGAYGFRGKTDVRYERLLCEALEKHTGIPKETFLQYRKEQLAECPASFDELRTSVAVIGELLLKLLWDTDNSGVYLPVAVEDWRLPVLQGMEYINQLYMSEIRVTDIAGFCHVSESHLHHLFKRAYGCGPYEMLLNRRLNEAKRLLRESNLPVYAIARKCGFSDANYFSAVFKKKNNISCLKYRAHIMQERMKKTGSAEAAGLP
ncbi:MAG: helix-turn-helix transcriptional regulator [Candidatus Limiplasma sp.]|nr:helix-turn-helix transcriptional regulator [Candidatus Limiplasma sp.]